jgi:hypothetical protein
VLILIGQTGVVIIYNPSTHCERRACKQTVKQLSNWLETPLKDVGWVHPWTMRTGACPQQANAYDSGAASAHMAAKLILNVQQVDEADEVIADDW